MLLAGSLSTAFAVDGAAQAALDGKSAPGEAAAAASKGGAGASETPVLVLPYQPIYRSAEPDKVEQATDLLVKELGRSEGVRVIRGGVAKDGAESPDFSPIETLFERAEELEAAKDIRGAIAAHRELIAEMERRPEAIEDAEDYIRAHHRLARALFWAGDDEDALEALATAARMAPSMELPPAEFSRYYRAQLRKKAAEVVEEGAAELLVRSALPGARILIDGREAATSPVRVQKAVPGKHLLQGILDGVPNGAQVVTLRPGGNDEVTIAFGDTWGGVAVGAVADAIAENTLSPKAVAKAVEAGQEAGATYVVAGGMAHDKIAAKFNVHTFVVDVASGGVMTLDTTNFDLDMLTAPSDVIRIVRAVEAAVSDFDDTTEAVASIESKIRPQAIETVFDAKPDLEEKRQPTVRRRRSGPRRVFKSVRGTGTLRIKDEEE